MMAKICCNFNIKIFLDFYIGTIKKIVLFFETPIANERIKILPVKH